MKRKMWLFGLVCICLLLGAGLFRGKPAEAEDVVDIYVKPAAEREWVVGDCVGEEDFYVYPVNHQGQIAEEPLAPEQYTVEPGSILVEGENIITVEYGQFFSYTTVIAKKAQLEGIVATVREGRELYVGEKLKKEDICVYAYYDSGYKEEVTNVVEIEEVSLQEGENEIQILYEYEDKLFLFLLKIPGESIKKLPLGTPLVGTGQAILEESTCVTPTPVPVKKTEIPKKKVSYSLSSSMKGVHILKDGEKKKTVYSRKKGQVVLKVSGIASIQYQMAAKGKKNNSWKKVKNKKISLKKMGHWQLYFRFQTEDGRTIQKTTNPFVLDWKKPKISGVKNGATYCGSVWFQCDDRESGIKKITLNGKKSAKKRKLSKSGVYKLAVQDYAGNQTRMKFTVVKPTPRPTPKPTKAPQVPTPLPYVPVESVRCSKRTVTLKVGKNVSLSATVLPGNATNKKVSWKSSDSGIVKVSASGRVTGKKKGTAYVIVRSKSNSKAYATCVVYVQ